MHVWQAQLWMYSDGNYTPSYTELSQFCSRWNNSIDNRKIDTATILSQPGLTGGCLNDYLPLSGYEILRSSLWPVPFHVLFIPDCEAFVACISVAEYREPSQCRPRHRRHHDSIERSIVEWHGIDYSSITWVKSRENHLMFITYNQQFGFQKRKYTYLIKSSRLQLWLQYQYNAVQSSMIILSWLRRNINQWLSSQLTPLISTSRVSYGVSIVGIF